MLVSSKRLHLWYEGLGRQWKRHRSSRLDLQYRIIPSSVRPHPPVIAVDTSVVVAAFASWHEAHAAAVTVLARGPRLPAHAALECYSVMTRLPPPHRAPAEIVGRFLGARFTEPYLTLPARAVAALLDRAIGLGISGGAIYDAMVGATARHAGARLLTRDRPALDVYRALDVEYELVG